MRQQERRQSQEKKYPSRKHQQHITEGGKHQCPKHGLPKKRIYILVVRITEQPRCQQGHEQWFGNENQGVVLNSYTQKMEQRED